jgi:hypothetical protein
MVVAIIILSILLAFFVFTTMLCAKEVTELIEKIKMKKDSESKK